MQSFDVCFNKIKEQMCICNFLCAKLSTESKMLQHKEDPKNKFKLPQ